MWDINERQAKIIDVTMFWIIMAVLLFAPIFAKWRWR